MNSRSPIARGIFGLVVHALHLFVLLMPTLLVAGVSGIGWTTCCFGIAIATAAVLESASIVPGFNPNNAAYQDIAAMRMAAVVGVCLLVLFWSAQIEQLIDGHRCEALQFGGTMLFVAGVTFRVASIRSLGAQFISDVRFDGCVMRDGIYARIRHPSEIGLLLIAIGGPLILGSLATSASAAIMLVPISVWRIRRENEALYNLSKTIVR